MKEENLDNILTMVANMATFGLLAYVVFWRGHSGWWMAFLLLFHFTTDKNIQASRDEEISDNKEKST